VYTFDMTAPHDLLSIQEVARYLRISDDTVRRQILQGDLPAIRIGTTPTGRARYRIPSSAVEKMLNGNQKQQTWKSMFAHMSNTEIEMLIDEAVQWSREQESIKSEVIRLPEPSAQALKNRFKQP
jgi:excisionase family DNA binding protein